MKSAEEWRKSRYFGNNSEDGIETIVQQIQLDAMKEGMRRAAKVVQDRGNDYDSECGFTDPETGAREYPRGGDEYMQDVVETSEAIFTTAEQLTEKDL